MLSAMSETVPDSGRAGASLVELVDVMDRLLAPDGCPWDREQTLDSLQPYLIEETFEVIEALDCGTPDDHCEELGDLLMQIVFQAAIRREEKAFAIDDVVRGIVDKLVRRHPHVFADATAEDAEAVLTQWEQIKAGEKAAKGGAAKGPKRQLAGVPVALPALTRAQKLSKRAAKVGFDWPDVAGCRAKVAEELAEIDGAVADDDADAIFHEVGDLLFAAVSLSRKLGCDSEAALRAANQRFIKRFEHIEDSLHAEGKTPAESDLEELDRLWNVAKKVTHNTP
jgi:MazG family protein